MDGNNHSLPMYMPDKTEEHKARQIDWTEMPFTWNGVLV